MPNTITCPQCNEENPESEIACQNCGTDLTVIHYNQSAAIEIAKDRQSNTSSFSYESTRVARLMDEYSKITNIKECREWENKARSVVSYMNDAVTKTEQFIFIERQRLGQASSETEKTQIKKGLMQFENFRDIIGDQLERLRKTVDALPQREDDNELVTLPPENVTLKKQSSKTTFLNSQVLRILILVIIAFLLWYFSNAR